jgi:hypothetical protein
VLIYELHRGKIVKLAFGYIGGLMLDNDKRARAGDLNCDLSR